MKEYLKSWKVTIARDVSMLISLCVIFTSKEIGQAETIVFFSTFIIYIVTSIYKREKVEEAKQIEIMEEKSSRSSKRRVSIGDQPNPNHEEH